MFSFRSFSVSLTLCLSFLFCFLSPSAGYHSGCNVTGIWVDTQSPDTEEYYIKEAPTSQSNAIRFEVLPTLPISWNDAQGFIYSNNSVTLFIDGNGYSPSSMVIQGTTNDSCNVLTFDNGVIWAKQQTTKYVHVVFSNHLDVG